MIDRERVLKAYKDYIADYDISDEVNDYMLQYETNGK